MTISTEDQLFLLSLARKTIKETLSGNGEQINDEVPGSLSKELTEPGASFVTLTKNGMLRGCIGSISEHRPLVEDVRENSISAAFRDPRFPPVADGELENIRIEISIMNPFVPLVYKSTEKLLEIIERDKPGMIISKGFKRALFLPQVWEQLPEPKEFLSHLCAKAGMRSDEWESGDLKIETNTVFKFKDKPDE